MKPSSPRPDALVVCSHLPDEGHFESQLCSTIAVLCADDYAYWAGLAAVWDSAATLILIEHDIEASDDHVAALLNCPHPLCSWAYRLNWISGFPRGGWAQRPIVRGGEWADRSGLGLCKITPGARVRALSREPWPRVELAVEEAVRGPWHVHWCQPGNEPVPHHHW